MAASSIAQAQGNLPDALYLVGSFNEWTVPADGGTNYALTDPDGDGIYTGEFTIEDTELQFKVFDSATAGWEDTENYFGTYYWSRIFSDQPAELPLASSYSGNIVITNWKGGKISVSAEKKTNDTDVEDPTYWELTLASSTQPLSTETVPPTKLYMIGYMQDWDIFSGNYALEMVEPQVFEATFDINAVSDYPYFRFYTELGDWSYGCISVVRPQDYEDVEYNLPLDLSDGPVTTPCAYGENGNWSLAGWDGGSLKIRVDLNKMEVTFEKTEAPKVEQIYLVGSMQGWNINQSNLTLEGIGENVYRGVFAVEEGSIFRFYTKLGDWDAYSIGSQANDSPIALDESIADIENTVTSNCVWGKGSWTITKWNGEGELEAVVDLNKMQVTFTHLDPSSVNGIENNAAESIYYDLFGRRVLNPDRGIYIRTNGSKTEKVVL